MKKSILRKALRKNIRFYYSFLWLKNKLNNLRYNDKEFYLRKFKKSHGEYPDLETPKAFSEKLVWSMLNYRDKRYIMCADKYAVRTFVKNTIGEEYLIKCYDIYNKIEDINFDKLPNKFVLKATHASGWNIICPNKNEINEKRTLYSLKHWFTQNYFNYNREWHYKYMPKRVICEEYIGLKDGTPPMDYKILCFNGIPKLILLDIARFKHLQCNIYDVEWNQIKDVQISHEQDYSKEYEKPKNLEEMLDVASKLSKGFEHVRIDLYNIDGKIHFGEMTFFHGAGVYSTYRPKEFDLLIGSWFQLPKANLDILKLNEMS